MSASHKARPIEIEPREPVAHPRYPVPANPPRRHTSEDEEEPGRDPHSAPEIDSLPDPDTRPGSVPANVVIRPRRP